YLDTFTDKNTHLILSNNLLFVFILLLLIVPLIIYYIKFLNKN
ncbi:sporulation integral membrane protein YlbJ, partial [Clostridium sporogenes]|nr:sporulation integral membrane protein YlbJ [Clostridium sporogenes]